MQTIEIGQNQNLTDCDIIIIIKKIKLMWIDQYDVPKNLKMWHKKGTKKWQCGTAKKKKKQTTFAKKSVTLQRTNSTRPGCWVIFKAGVLW